MGEAAAADDASSSVRAADENHPTCKLADCDRIFISCNFEEEKQSDESKANLDNALMRFEFVEALVRAAVAKYLEVRANKHGRVGAPITAAQRKPGAFAQQRAPPPAACLHMCMHAYTHMREPTSTSCLHAVFALLGPIRAFARFDVDALPCFALLSRPQSSPHPSTEDERPKDLPSAMIKLLDEHVLKLTPEEAKVRMRMRAGQGRAGHCAHCTDPAACRTWWDLEHDCPC